MLIVLKKGSGFPEVNKTQGSNTKLRSKQQLKPPTN